MTIQTKELYSSICAYFATEHGSPLHPFNSFFHPMPVTTVPSGDRERSKNWIRTQTLSLYRLKNTKSPSYLKQPCSVWVGKIFIHQCIAIRKSSDLIGSPGEFVMFAFLHTIFTTSIIVLLLYFRYFNSQKCFFSVAQCPEPLY